MAFLLPKSLLPNINYEDLDFSLIGTWTGAVAAIFAAAWGVYVYMKKNQDNNDSIKKSKNVINASSLGKGKLIIKAKQKINSSDKK